MSMFSGHYIEGSESRVRFELLGNVIINLSLPHLELTPRVYKQVRLEGVLGSVAQVSGKDRDGSAWV